MLRSLLLLWNIAINISYRWIEKCLWFMQLFFNKSCWISTTSYTESQLFEIRVSNIGIVTVKWVTNIGIQWNLCKVDNDNVILKIWTFSYLLLILIGVAAHSGKIMTWGYRRDKSIPLEVGENFIISHPFQNTQ